MIYLFIAVVGITTSSIELVLNIVGSVSGISLSILMPCFFYVNLIIRKKKQLNYKFYIAWGLITLIMPYSLFAIIAKYF